jgi:acyl phosphate:glycerol-3-phosphate acyltransferase
MSEMGWGIWLVGSYLLGSVPFGLLIGLTRGVDIRDSGSGNVGATNAGRVLGRGWGILCFILDVLKGLGPTLGYGFWSGLAGVTPLTEPASEIGSALAALGWMAVASAAVFGHVFPIWLRFKGGKGVATGLGVLLGFWPVLTLPGITTALIWVALVKLKGYVSLASVVASGSLPLLAVVSGLCWQRKPGEIAVYAGVGAVLAILIALRHRGNLSRLRAGTEPKAGWTQKPKP